MVSRSHESSSEETGTSADKEPSFMSIIAKEERKGNTSEMIPMLLKQRIKSDKYPSRYVVYCKDDSKGFMPIDLELEK